MIIAVYQAADLVGGAISSVLAQTEPPHEIVVCDDGSTDALDAALAPFLDRLTLLRQANLGEGKAKNRAAGAATGDFVVILDADDVWEPERLAALGELARARPDLDILTTDAWFDVGGELRDRFYGAGMQFPIDAQAIEMLDRCFVMPHAAVRRARWLELGGFDVAMRPASDWDFYVRAVLGGSSVGMVAAPLARYRLRPDSMSADRAPSLRARVRVLDKTAGASDLAPQERAALERSRRRHERRARLAEAEEALRAGAPGARWAALALARAPDVSLATRVKAISAALAPATAGRRLATQDDDRLRRPHTQ